MCNKLSYIHTYYHNEFSTCHVIKGGCKLVNAAQVMRILSIVVRSVSWGRLRRLTGKVVCNSL